MATDVLSKPKDEPTEDFPILVDSGERGVIRQRIFKGRVEVRFENESEEYVDVVFRDKTLSPDKG
jgi:hypothetical protein